MINLQLLTKEEVENNSLHLLTYKTAFEVTDFVSSIDGASTWTTDSIVAKQGIYPRNEGAFEAVVVNKEGKMIRKNLGELEGIRPAVKYSEIEKECKNLVCDEMGVGYVEYGEYPQSKALDSKKLDEELEKGELKETKKTYSILDKTKIDPEEYAASMFSERFVINYRKPFIELKEYINKDGKKYVKNGDTWYCVEPIKWRINIKHDIAITEKVINNGIHLGEDYNIKKFVKEYLSKDILRSRRSKVKVTKINLNKVKEIININRSEVELDTSNNKKIKSK